MRKRKETRVGKAIEQGKDVLWGVLKFVGTVAASAVVSVVVVEKFQQYRKVRQNPEPEPLPEASPHPAMVFTGQTPAHPKTSAPIVQYIFAPKAVENPEPEVEEVEVEEVEEVDADEAYLDGWLNE